MKWHMVVDVLQVVAARLLPGLLAGGVILLVDAGLLDAQLGRAVHDALSRQYVSSLTQASTPVPRLGPTAW